MIIIESDMKLGKQRKVTLDEAYRSLIATNHLSKKELNFKLLNNETVGNDRLYYYRMIPYLNPAMDKVIKKYKKQLEADIRNFYGIKKRGWINKLGCFEVVYKCPKCGMVDSQEVQSWYAHDPMRCPECDTVMEETARGEDPDNYQD